MNEASDLQSLYRQTVLEHSRQPHNFVRLEPADRVSVGHNPLCGDKITVYLNVDDDKIGQLTFEGTGCAISIASASIMTEAVRSETLESAQRQIDGVLKYFADENGKPDPGLSDMAALGGVREFPTRIKCATLAWKTLESALKNNHDTATTET